MCGLLLGLRAASSCGQDRQDDNSTILENYAVVNCLLQKGWRPCFALAVSVSKQVFYAAPA